MTFQFTLQCALNAHNPDNYVVFDDMIPQSTGNPERILIEKDNFNKLLSPKAQEAVRLICTSPELFQPKIRSGTISWTGIGAYLRKHHNLKWKDVNKIRKEIVLWLEASDR